MKCKRSYLKRSYPKPCVTYDDIICRHFFGISHGTWHKRTFITNIIEVPKGGDAYNLEKLISRVSPSKTTELYGIKDDTDYYAAKELVMLAVSIIIYLLVAFMW